MIITKWCVCWKTVASQVALSLHHVSLTPCLLLHSSYNVVVSVLVLYMTLWSDIVLSDTETACLGKKLLPVHVSHHVVTWYMLPLHEFNTNLQWKATIGYRNNSEHHSLDIDILGNKWSYQISLFHWKDTVFFFNLIIQND